MVEDAAGGVVGVLDLHRHRLGIIGALAVLQDLHRHRGKALRHRCDGAGGRHLDDGLVAGLERHLGVLGEIGVQVVIEGDRLRGIHGQAVPALKEADVAGVADVLVLVIQHIIGLVGGVAAQDEHIRHRLIVLAIALVALFQHLDRKGHTLIRPGIADADDGGTGGHRHDLVVDHTGHAGLGGGKLQQLRPLGVGSHHRLQGEHLVGAEGQALLQALEVEVGVLVGQTDLVGGVVEGVIVAGQHKGVFVDRLVLDLIDVIGQLKGHVGGAVLLGVYRDHILLKGLHLRYLVAVFVGAGHHVAGLHTHGVVVVVQGYLGKQLILFLGLVVLVVVFHVADGGGLKVRSQRELDDVLLVGGQAAVAVVHVAHQPHGVLAVVGQIVLLSIEFDLDVGGADGAAVSIGLTHVVVHTLKHHLAGGIVGDGDIDLAGAAEQTAPHKPQGVDRALLVGQGDVIPAGGDDDVLGILHKVVGAQIADKVAGDAAHRTGGIGVRHQLILRVDAVVQLVGVGVVVIQVKHGGHGPVTVEGQIGHAQVDLGAAGGLQGDEALHVHTVFKGLVQILLILIAEGDPDGDLGVLAAGHGDLMAPGGAALHRHDLHLGTLQHVGFFGDGGLTGVGLGVADTLGDHVGAQVIGQGLIAEVADRKGHLVDAGLVRVVPQFQLGGVHLLAVLVVGDDAGRGVDGGGQVGQAGALLAHRIGLAVGVDDDVGGGHHQPVDHGGHSAGVIGDLGEVLHHVLVQQHRHARQVGAGHGGAGQTVVAAAGDRGEDVAAVGGDLRLDAQAGGGTPGGEVGHKGAGGLVPGNEQGAAALGGQHLAVVLGDGAHRQGGVADVHLDITGDVVVDDDADGALGLGDQRLFLKGVGAAAHQGDLALYIQAGVVGGAAHAGHRDKLGLDRILLAQEGVEEMLFLTGVVVGLVEVDDGLSKLYVGGLHAVDRGHRHGALVGAGGAHRAGVGVGGQGQVAVGLGAVGGVVAVGGGHHHGDAGLADAVVHAVQQLLLTLVAKAAGGTQGHIDHVHTQHHAVLQRRQYPGAEGRILHVGEYLHGHQLGIGRHAGDGIVPTHDHAGHVGAVVVVGGIHVRVLIRIVVAEGNLFVDVDVVHRQALGQFAGLGLAHQGRHVLIGQAQGLGGEIVHREGGVVGVQTGVQHRHHHTGAVVGHVGGVEDTGFVYVDVVLHQLGLSRAVGLAQNGLFAGAQGHTGDRIVPRFDQQLKAAEQSVVVLAGCILHALLVQQGQNLRLAGRDAVGDRFGLLGGGVLLQAHGLVGAVVGVHQRGLADLDDHRHVLVGGYAAGQAEHHVAVQIVGIVHPQGTIPLAQDVALCGTLLGKHHRDRAQYDGHSRQHAQHPVQSFGEMSVLHDDFLSRHGVLCSTYIFIK